MSCKRKRYMASMEEKEKKLEQLLATLESAVVAFSGGVDSSYLLYKAREVLGDKVLAVTAESEIFPEHEREMAVRLAQKLGAEHVLIKTEMLSRSDFAGNPPQRCYYCKKEFFTQLWKIAREHALNSVCDGANRDDRDDFRPGIRAAGEMGVRSPLMEAGITKEEIRSLSRKAGLETWNLPSAACLASRIPYGETITGEKLKAVAQAESFLKSLGHKTVRVRYHQATARIEVPAEEIPALAEKAEEIADCLKPFGFSYVALDLEGYRSGSMNEVLREEEKK